MKNFYGDRNQWQCRIATKELNVDLFNKIKIIHDDFRYFLVMSTTSQYQDNFSAFIFGL